MKRTQLQAHANKVNKTQPLKPEFESPGMRFDYPSLDNKKRTHDLLKHLRNTAAEAKKLSLNQQRLIKKPDHFVDLLTGDHMKQLHEKRSKARKYNQKQLVNNVYQSYEFDHQKAVLQANSYSKQKHEKLL